MVPKDEHFPYVPKLDKTSFIHLPLIVAFIKLLGQSKVSWFVHLLLNLKIKVKLCKQHTPYLHRYTKYHFRTPYSRLKCSKHPPSTLLLLYKYTKRRVRLDAFIQDLGISEPTFTAMTATFLGERAGSKRGSKKASIKLSCSWRNNNLSSNM